MKISEIPAYVAEHRGIKISRMTAYNWVNIGVGGVKLRVVSGRPKRKGEKKFWKAQPLFAERLTTAEWLERFLLATDIEARAAR